MLRKEALVTGEVYHIYNRSIAEFRIFQSTDMSLRMQQSFGFFQFGGMPMKFSTFMDSLKVEQSGFANCLNSASAGKEKTVQVICYCIMPTHFHFILRQTKNSGIAAFLGNLQNSYTRYFNLRHKRKGPLWEGRFKNVLVKTDRQLLHLTRYIHLNPVTDNLVEQPQEWRFSSYGEYLQQTKEEEHICEFKDLLKIEPDEYARFVKNRISYQRELAKIKRLLLE